jgi:hypothetical protein
MRDRGILSKEDTLLAGLIICSLLSIDTFSTKTVLSQSQILDVASDELIAPIGEMVHWYTFSVPEEAVNPRLIGRYEVLSGLDIDVTVLDQEGCGSWDLKIEPVWHNSAVLALAV